MIRRTLCFFLLGIGLVRLMFFENTIIQHRQTISIKALYGVNKKGICDRLQLSQKESIHG